MSTTTLNPKKALLLGAGLDVFHFESREWMDTIDFWKDEIRFFNDLLKRKEVSINNNPDYENMLKNLDKIHTVLLDDLEQRIVEHEQLLSQILQKENVVSDSEYREKHRILFNSIEVFKNDMKSFKKIVFKYAKGL